MIDWQTIQATLLAWVTDVTGLYALGAEEPRGYLPSVHASIRLTAVESVGIDETRLTYDADADGMVHVQTGVRHLTIAFVVESHSQRPSDTAKQYLEQLRTRLRAPSALATFRTAGLALIDAAPFVPTDYTVDDRVISRGNVSVRFALAVNDVANAETGDRIAAIAVSSDVSDADGASLPADQQIDTTITA